MRPRRVKPLATRGKCGREMRMLANLLAQCVPDHAPFPRGKEEEIVLLSNVLEQRRRVFLLHAGRRHAFGHWGPRRDTSACSCSNSAGLRSVSGGRTGPASCPAMRAPALTMLTA